MPFQPKGAGVIGRDPSPFRYHRCQLVNSRVRVVCVVLILRTVTVGIDVVSDSVWGTYEGVIVAPRSVDMVRLEDDTPLIRQVFEDYHTGDYRTVLIVWTRGGLREFVADSLAPCTATFEISNRRYKCLRTV